MSTMDESAQSKASEVTQKKQKTGLKSGLIGNHGKSEVWDYFDKHLDAETRKYKGTAECKFCNAKIISPSSMGTNKLWTHTKKCKNFPRDQVDKSQAVISFMGSQGIWKFDQELCRKSLARMIILCELPFSHVEKEGFKLFCHDLQPKFHVVSRTTVAKDCLYMFHEEKNKLKGFLKSLGGRIYITTDMWTSIQNLGYMVLTAHFVDNDWNLNKKIINFRVLLHPHKGEAIAKAVEGCLMEWGLEKILTITLDNAKNNDTCVVDLKKRLNKRNMLLLGGEYFHVRCFAHVLNLVVRDGIDEVKTTIKRLRRSVKYVRSSPSRLQLFKKCALEENIVSKKVVCLDVKTRWNSTYLIIDAAMVFEKAFDRFEEQDIGYKKECEVLGMMEEIDWDKLKWLHKVLEDFYLLTKRISGSHYVTSNTYFDEVSQVKELLMNDLTSDDSFGNVMAVKMNEKFNKYCSIDSLNQILIVAIVLDPRYKVDYVEFWYKTFLGYDTLISEERKNRMIEKFVGDLKGLMSRIYLNYKAESSSFLDVASFRMDGDMPNSSGNTTKRSLKKDEFRANQKRKEHVDAFNDLDKYLNDGTEEDDPFRSSLKPTTLECLVCIQDWLKSPMPFVSVEESLEELEEIENVVTQKLESLSIGST